MMYVCVCLLFKLWWNTQSMQWHSRKVLPHPLPHAIPYTVSDTHTHTHTPELCWELYHVRQFVQVPSLCNCLPRAGAFSCNIDYHKYHLKM